MLEFARQMIPNSRKEFTMLLFGFAFGFVLLFLTEFGNLPKSDIDKVPIPMLPFPEPAWRTPDTLEVKVLASNSHARFEVHKVRTENGIIVNDWLWTDERSHLNILVHLKTEDKYLLFRQNKYGLDKDYYAPIGGFVNVGETAEDAARRELIDAASLEPGKLTNLGKYRVQVNRGGGFLHCFIARDCILSQDSKLLSMIKNNDVMKLTRNELINVFLSGDFGSIEWVAAVGIGLLQEDYDSPISQ